MLTRRSFAGLVVGFSAGILPALAADEEKKDVSANAPPEKEEILPIEDLMREHGALNRMLLIYEQGRDSFAQAKPFPRDVIFGTATIMRKFIEDYHEKLEEDHIFPRFQKAGVLVDLTKTLKLQHDAGRKLTSTILASSETDAALSSGITDVINALSDFIRMYRPHEAREDTVLFPAFHALITEKEYKLMGEQFEEQEHKLFGEGGFNSIVDQIAEYEKKIGINDLFQFTA